MLRTRLTRCRTFTIGLILAFPLGALPGFPVVAGADRGPSSPDWQAIADQSLSTLREYVRIDTTNPPADVRPAAAFLERLLKAEGVEVHLFESSPGHVNLLARLEATAPTASAAAAPRPVLLLHHMDVVPVDRSRWNGDPFSGEISDGFLRGRGSVDMKSLGVIHVETLLLLKRMGVPRNREILLLATADEETGGEAGALWMIKNHWSDLNPEFVLDEGGFGSRDLIAASGKLVFAVAVAEKRPLWLRVLASGTAAHGSQPLPDNAVERVDAALARILAWRDGRTRPRTPAALRPLLDAVGPLAENKFTRAIQQDTISLTTFHAGVGDPPKVNVIPSRAEATLDCRLLPGTDADLFLSEIRRVAGPEVTVETIRLAEAASPSSIDTALFEAIRKIIAREDSEAIVAPLLIPYGTDSNAFRARGATAYGFLPAEIDASIVASMHGDAEKFPVKELGRGVRRLYEILTEFLGY